MAVALIVQIGLIAIPGTNIPAEASPSSNFGVGVHLKEYSIEMLLSTEHDTNYVVLGWVDVNDMRLGETVSVQISCTSYPDIYGVADPQWFVYDRDGRKYFNLTVTLKEDAPINEDYKFFVSATAKTYLDQAISDVELLVTLTYQFSATYSLVNRPSEVEPGELSEGVLKITNTGSIYGEYSLKVISDPDSIVKDISFRRGPSLTPGFYDDFPFLVEVAEDAPPGKHSVTLELWGTTQYDTGDRMGTFTVDIRVAETSWIGTSTMWISMIVIIAIICLTAYVLRRKT